MNGLSLRQLECFLEVCRDFHFTKAARRLGMAQPPLSRQIRELESRIGARLFERSGKAASLTPAGAALLKETYPLPALLARAVSAARRASAGESAVLRVGFVGAILGDALLSLFQSFRERHPDTQLSLADLAPAELVARLERGELDGAFLGVKPGKLPQSLRAHAWKREPLLVCMAADHPLAERRSIAIEELARENLVTLSAELAPAYRDFLDKLFLDSGARPPAAIETNGAQAMLGMVVAGCGVALLPLSATAPAMDRVRVVKLAGKGARIEEAFVCAAEPGVALRRLLECVDAYGRSGA